MHLIADERPDGSATYLIAVPIWEVRQDGATWRIVTHAPGTRLRSERSAPLASACEARRVAATLAAHWLRTCACD